MAFTDALDVSIGAATKASDYDNLADNTEFNREKTNAEHDLDISTGAGKHKSISFLNSTDVIALKAGSASLPPLTAEGDLNTGMFFPAADTLGWATAGALRLKIDPSGNVITSGKAVIGKSTSDTQDLVIEQSADNTLGGLRIYETGGVDWTALYSSGGVAYLQNQDTYMSLNPNGVAINDGSGSANMTIGLTINQGANDNEILAFKSSDVAHGMTDLTETDTYGTVDKSSATEGALQLTGYSEGIIGAWIKGRVTSTNATRTTGANAAVRISAALKSGATVGSMGANVNMALIEDNGTVRFIFDSDGDSHQDVGTAWTNFDAYEDVAITRALGMTLSPETIVQTKWDDWGKANRELVYEVGLMQRLTPEQEANGERSLVNMTTLAKVHNGAIGQLYASQKDLELMVTEELEQLKAQVNNLLMERN